MWQEMRRVNIRENWINIIKRLYNVNSVKIKISNNLTMPISKGLKQGYGMQQDKTMYGDSKIQNRNTSP